MKYDELESALTAACGRGELEDKVRALQALSRFYAYCGKTLWSFEFNREPSLTCAVVSFPDWDAFDEFFGTLPKDLEYASLLGKAREAYGWTLDAAGAAKLDALAAESSMELAGVEDLAGDDAAAEKAQERAGELYAALKNEEGLGDVSMGRAHRARYRTYDMDACRRLLQEARTHFDAAGSKLGAAHAVLRLAQTYDPGISGKEKAEYERLEALHAEASALFEAAGDKASAANCLAGVAQMYKDAGVKDREESAYLRCLAYIEKNFTGEDLAKNYAAAARFYDERGSAEKADDYRRKAAALGPKKP